MKKKFLIMLSAVLLLSAALPPLAGADSRDDDSTVRCAPVHVAAPKGTRVVSVTAAAQPGGTVTLPNLPPVTDVPAYCDITITLTHPGAGDSVRVKLVLPQDRGRWNGRFQATGGSAYLAGDLDGIIATPLLDGVKNGYATAATDAGVGQNPIDVSDWALTTTGRVNRPLLQNFASRSLHDLAVVGKSATATFYGQDARYAYWNGCSTGGRQGYQLAQDYPQDFQGILAKAPAINWDRFAVAALWSQAVFNSEHVQPTQCELTAFTDAAVRACDRLDGRHRRDHRQPRCLSLGSTTAGGHHDRLRRPAHDDLPGHRRSCTQDLARPADSLGAPALVRPEQGRQPGVPRLGRQALHRRRQLGPLLRAAESVLRHHQVDLPDL